MEFSIAMQFAFMMKAHPDYMLRIVPSDVWLTPDQVENTDWFRDHPWNTRDLLKRKRSSSEHM
jgi:hypothetical protein